MTSIPRRSICASLAAAAALPLLPRIATAAAPKLRFATLAPRGSLYHRALQQVGEAWRKAEGSDAAFTVFTDGAQGGELDVVRRMRIGQLNGAMVTVMGLNAIEPGAAALQFMPLVFRSWEELDAASAKLRPVLEQRMLERGFVVLYWGEAGWVRYFSKAPVVRPADLKPLKIASSTAVPQQVELMTALGFHPVVLENADVLPGLSTGLIDAVPSTADLALAMQIDTAARHMVEMRWAPIVGAAVVTRKAWDSLSSAGQATLRAASQQATAQLRAAREAADQQAIAAMVRRGLVVHALTAEAEREWEALVAKIQPVIRGRIVPADMFDAVQQAVGEYRALRGKA